MTVDLPSWWHPLAERAADSDSALLRHRPPDTEGIPAAVLILLGEGDDGPEVLLTQRAATLRNHAGQPSFPGGVTDPGDNGPVDTALREAVEEVAVDIASVTVVASLPELWLSVTNYRVTPVLAWWHSPHQVTAVDPSEVETVALVPLRSLADPANRVRVRHPSGYIGPAFQTTHMLVWGFTAGILDALLRIGGWERPWDPSRIVSL